MEGDERDAGGRELNAAAASFTEDLVLEILSWLPAKALHRFKCVSRQWFGLISNPDHRTKLDQTLAGFFYIGYTCGGPKDIPVKSLRFSSARAGPGGPPPLIDPSVLSAPRFCENVHRVDCSNGLLLRCWKPGARNGFCYAVCNPATDEWAALPDSPTCGAGCCTVRLAFDPAASPRVFRVFEFASGAGPRGRTTTVEIYSSETGAWTHRECGWENGAGVTLRDESSSVFFDGMLRLAPINPVIVAVDGDGKTWTSAPKPSDPDDDGFLGGPAPGFIAQSQGRLHFLNTLEYDHMKLCVWELDDSGVWAKKHSVNLRELFAGRWDYRVGLKYSVIGIHPDCNIVYFLQGENHTLVSYAMARGEGCVIRDLGYTNYVPYLPYVPLFSVSLAL
ncbi:F-box protein At5g07610-like [Phragmites australis]|uniref:F-box protein At5g07610-like n=1 Tax=Phragmites australis TaxID=29695 RepID=UPI002D7653BD|nr:F-box protein At5g07610-like [Phragmites australis]